MICPWIVIITTILPLLSTTASGSGSAIQPNDNRRPAGHLSGNLLTLRLEIREGLWNPEGENGPQIPVLAFAEEGKSAFNPGPLIRVPLGTRVHVSTHNLLPKATVTIHGFHSHSGLTTSTVLVKPLRTKDAEFQLDQAGTFFYWGSISGAQLDKRNGGDAQLSGAIVVDPIGAASQEDRIFVLSHWLELGDPKASPAKPDRETWTINGKSWPDTERLIYPVGKQVLWRWINATDENHPLHLHGQYFSIDGVGDEMHWTNLSVATRRRAVTEVLTSGSSLNLSWIAERPGKWLFHCHVLFHTAPELRQTPNPAATQHAEHDGAMHMAGLVLGITVKPLKPGTAPEQASQPRRLQLIVGRREGIDLHGKPGLGYQLLESGHRPMLGVKAFTSPGPTIVLTRDVPAEIAVENRLPESTSVHWHGIELDSYYDGVPGWGGEEGHISPSISPGQTFIARFTPPRAGTFMYHTHLNDYVQISTGLYGPLIILDPGQKFDPESDKIFVMSRGGPDDEKDPFLINGSARPSPIELRVGRSYRFRFIGITPAPNLQVTLDRNGRHENWLAIAKDGATLPLSQATRQASVIDLYPGETYDFRFLPLEPGILRLTALQTFFKLRTELSLIVRP